MMASIFRILALRLAILAAIPHVSAGQSNWEFLGGPYGGRITGMAETSAGVLYASTYGAGLQRSTDGGESWAQINFSATHHNQTVHTIFVDLNDRIVVASAEGQIYASDTGSDFGLISEVTGFPTAFSRNPINGKLVLVLHDGSYGYSIFESADDGQSWSPIVQNSPLLAGGFFDFHLLATGSLIGVSSANGVVVSADGGLNFSTRNGAILNNAEPTFSLVVAPNGDLYRLTYKGIYRSSDQGASWTSIKGNLPGSHFSGRLLIHDGHLMFFNSSENTSGGQSVFSSVLGNSTWTRVSDEFLCYEGERFDVFVSSNGSLFSLFDGKGIRQSTDDGVTWSASDEGITAIDFHDLVETDQGTLIMSDGGGLSTFIPGNGAWLRYSFLSQPLNLKPAIMTFETGADAVVLNGNRIYSTLDGGRTWSARSNASYFFWTASRANGKIYAFATRQLDGTRVILRSDDQGVTWVVEYFFESTSGSFVMDYFAMDESRNAYVGVLEDDNSITVVRINLDSKSATPLRNVPYLHGLYEEYGRLFVVTSGSGAGWEVSYSDNQGGSFSELPIPNMIEPPGLKIYEDELFVLGPFGAVFRTSDEGSNWQNWLNFLEGHFTSTRNIVRTNLGNYYELVQNKGLFLRLPAIKIGQSIAFSPMTDREIRLGGFEPEVHSTCGLPVTLTSSDETIARVEGMQIIPLGEGSVQITASQSGSSYCEPAVPVQMSLNVIKSPQEIVLGTLPEITVASESFDLPATATSGLVVEFESTSPGISLTGKRVTVLEAGVVSITVRQPGNGIYHAAVEKSYLFCVRPNPPGLTLVTGTPSIISSNASGTHTWYKDGEAIPGQTNSIQVTDQGTYTAKVTVNSCESTLSDAVILAITGLDRDSEVNVFPNPVAVGGEIFVALPQQGPSWITLYDVQGRVVNHVKGDETEIRLTTGGLRPGLYLLEIRQHSARTIRLVIR